MLDSATRQDAVGASADQGRKAMVQWTMPELFERLFVAPSADPDRAQWLAELHALHGSLHEKIEDECRCPVCGEQGVSRQ